MKLVIDGLEICIAGDPQGPDPLRRVAWAGFAPKRGAVMSITDEEKDEALALIAGASDAAAALDNIAASMSGQEWNADTLDTIATIIRATGRTIEDVGE